LSYHWTGLLLGGVFHLILQDYLPFGTTVVGRFCVAPDLLAVKKETTAITTKFYTQLNL
jgi:hypothetical protein